VDELALAWEAMGDALQLSGELSAANEAVSAARALVGDDRPAQARLFLQHTTIARRAGRLTAAVRWGSRGLRALEGATDNDTRALRARLLAVLSYVRQRQARLPEAERLCRTAIAEAEAVDEEPALAYASFILDLVLVEAGRDDEAIHSARALEIYERLGDLEQQGNVLNNLAMFAYFRESWDEALELFEQAAQRAERAGNAGDFASTLSNIGEILSDRGDYEEAARRLRRAQQVSSATGERTSAANATVQLGRLAVRTGRYEEGLTSLRLACDELRRLGEYGYAEFARCLLAEANALGGDPQLALSEADRLFESADRSLTLLHRVRGVALVRVGDRAAGLRELNRSVEAAREQGVKFEVACGLDLLEVLGEPSPERARERDAILEELRIVQLPAPPVRGDASRKRPSQSAAVA
jgi:tetratricopeptide (TPR) repeat protein